MARVTYVKKAQQRFEQVPVIDPETGEQKRVPVMKNGVQKTTKTGRPVFMRLTTEDRSRPKPNLRCDFPGCSVEPKPGEILPGQSYKHISPKSGPYGGRQLNRHAEHPSWNVWEYSSSLSARLAQISHDFWEEIAQVTSEDDVQSALDSAAEQIKEIAEEKRESASNIEEGFGHPTQASEDLENIADELESWADEIESADIPDLPEPEDSDCDNCDGTGEVETAAVQNGEASEMEPCEECNGTGTIEAGDEPTEDQIDEWRSELQDALTIVDEAPV
jgi:hypothetical protein